MAPIDCIQIELSQGGIWSLLQDLAWAAVVTITPSQLDIDGFPFIKIR